MSGNLTIGDTPNAAMAGTASCIAPSKSSSALLLHNINQESPPSKFPCSQSTKTQSTPDRASTRDMFAPGSICQAPRDFLPSLSAVRNRFDACIVVRCRAAPRNRSELPAVRAGLIRRAVDDRSFMLDLFLAVGLECNFKHAQRSRR